MEYIDAFVLKEYVPPEEVTVMLVEPIQGEGGYVVPSPEYFPRLRKLADKYGILLIADEVQSGLGRKCKWFAIEHWNVEPDIICTSKSFSLRIANRRNHRQSKSYGLDWRLTCKHIWRKPRVIRCGNVALSIIK